VSQPFAARVPAEQAEKSVYRRGGQRFLGQLGRHFALRRVHLQTTVSEQRGQQDKSAKKGNGKRS